MRSKPNNSSRSLVRAERIIPSICYVHGGCFIFLFIAVAVAGREIDFLNTSDGGRGKGDVSIEL